MVTAIKGSEDAASGEKGGADLIVRAVNVTPEAARATIDLALVGRTLEADFGPYQVRTYRVPRSGDPVELDLLELPVGE